MDANQARYWHLCDGDDLRTRSPRLVWCARREGLVLAQAQTLRLPVRDPMALNVSATASPQIIDAFDQVGSLNSEQIPSDNPLKPYEPRTLIIVDAGHGPLPLRAGPLNHIVSAPLGTFQHLSIGGDGRLAALYSDGSKHGVLVVHLAHRWVENTELPLVGQRVAIDAKNHIWVATTSALLRVTGGPLPQPYVRGVARFEPEPENPHPLQLDDQVLLPTNPSITAISGICIADSDVVLLVSHGDSSQSLIRIDGERIGPRMVDAFPLAKADLDLVVSDVAWLGAERFALLAPVVRTAQGAWSGLHDCAVVTLRAADLSANPVINAGVTLVTERYPLTEPTTPWFVPGMDGVVRYHSVGGPRGLYPLAIPRYPDAVVGQVNDTLDSGILDCTWHRVYLDAHIPPGCRIRIYVRSSDAKDQWNTAFQRLPDVTWNPLASELPFAHSVAGHERDVRGLFETLIQSENGRVRTIRGRYLQLRIGLFGDGRLTPVLHAMRVYFPRFSYQEQYLPPHLRQQEQPAPGIPGAANGADVRERFFAALEGVLTPLEGNVAEAQRWFDPWSVPTAALPWLSRSVGLELDPAWPEARARRYVASAGRLQQLHGTPAGVALALDLATDGGVGRGQIVVVENFRLRRSMATLLGIFMDDAKNPLTLGTMVSGNSIVGDSLILSDDASRAFLALFDPALASSNERAAVQQFFDRYAHQVSILLHGPARQAQAAVERTLQQAMPAHVQWRVLATDHPFVLGLSPLLKLDTYLEITPPPRPVVVGDTWISREGYITNPPALSPADVAD